MDKIICISDHEEFANYLVVSNYIGAHLKELPVSNGKLSYVVFAMLHEIGHWCDHERICSINNKIILNITENTMENCIFSAEQHHSKSEEIYADQFAANKLAEVMYHLLNL